MSGPPKLPQSVRDWNDDDSGDSAVEDMPLAERLNQKQACQVASGCSRPASAASTSSANQQQHSRLPQHGHSLQAGTQQAHAGTEPGGGVGHVQSIAHVAAQSMKPSPRSASGNQSAQQAPVQIPLDDAAQQPCTTGLADHGIESLPTGSNARAEGLLTELDFDIDIDVFDGLDVRSPAAPTVAPLQLPQGVVATEQQLTDHRAGHLWHSPRQHSRLAEAQQAVSADRPCVTGPGLQPDLEFNVDIDDDFAVPSMAAVPAGNKQSMLVTQTQAGRPQHHNSLPQSSVAVATLPACPSAAGQPSCSSGQQPAAVLAVDSKPAERLHCTSPKQQTQLAAEALQLCSHAGMPQSADYGRGAVSASAVQLAAVMVQAVECPAGRLLEMPNSTKSDKACRGGIQAQKQTGSAGM